MRRARLDDLLVAGGDDPRGEDVVDGQAPGAGDRTEPAALRQPADADLRASAARARATARIGRDVDLPPERARADVHDVALRDR